MCDYGTLEWKLVLPPTTTGSGPSNYSSASNSNLGKLAQTMIRGWSADRTKKARRQRVGLS